MHILPSSWRIPFTCLVVTAFTPVVDLAAQSEPKVPRFSIDYMDKGVEPAKDFYQYAVGTWMKENPVPSDKSRWGSFNEVDQRNWALLHGILESTASAENASNSVGQKVGDFFKSAMDTNRLEDLGLKPLAEDLRGIDGLKTPADLFGLLADFHERGIDGFFGIDSGPDDKNSGFYAFGLNQGGCTLPDRDYYLKTNFAEVRAAYLTHLQKMFGFLGDDEATAAQHAATVMDLETSIAKLCKPRVELRDPEANYHKMTVMAFVRDYPDLPFPGYLKGLGLTNLQDLIVGQPEFVAGINKLIKERPIEDWKVYLRWHLLHASAPYLTQAINLENFAFFGTTISGTPSQEPRWQRAGRLINACIGEALGQLFVEKYFPPEAKARVNEMVENIKDVFRDRLANADWMSNQTRNRALAKFAKFTQKTGYPDKFRDYSAVEIRPDDYLGNVRRSTLFEMKRRLARVGKPVDKTEWGMTPPTVNAYFNGSYNEIVFPAGILQPPFFDMTMDDAVNYGGIGVVIGHEITHGYDDQGRKYDAEGNLSNWWTEADVSAFDARAQKLVDEYAEFEPLPGEHVNGKLTLGENIADLGGASVAYEALERLLKKDPTKRRKIDGFTPEQRYFISFAQVWRTNSRKAETERLMTVDVHTPGQFRAIGASVNLQEFFDAFEIKEGAPMWRAPELRAKIW